MIPIYVLIDFADFWIFFLNAATGHILGPFA